MYTKVSPQMNKPLVSVFMVTYNHEPYITKALESVLKQKTTFAFELVIGEDCSTDGTRSIIKAYESRFPNIIKPVYQEKNVGAMRNAFEFALPLCQGKYMAYLEGDDFWNDPFKLQKQVDFLEHNNEYGLVHSDVDHFYEADQTTIQNYNKTNSIIIPEGNIFEDLLDPENYLIKAPSAVFRKELMDRYFEFSVILEHDWVVADQFMWLSIAKFAKFKYFPEALATYRVLKDSLSNTKDFRKRLKIHQSVFGIKLFFIGKYGCKDALAKKVQERFLAALAFDALKLRDRELAKWIHEYKKKHHVQIKLKSMLTLFLVHILGLFFGKSFQM